MNIQKLFIKILPIHIVVSFVIYLFNQKITSVIFYLVGSSITILFLPFLISETREVSKDMDDENLRFKRNQKASTLQDKNEMIFILEPLAGTNIIKFAMLRNEVQNKLQKKPNIISLDDKKEAESEDYGFLVVHYEKDSNSEDICKAIEFFDSSKVYLGTNQVMNEETENVLKIVNKEFKNCKLVSDKIISLENELVFLQKKKHSKISKIILGRKGYLKEKNEILEDLSSADSLNNDNTRKEAKVEKFSVDDEILFYKHNIIKFIPSGAMYRQIFTKHDYVELLQEGDKYFSMTVLEKLMEREKNRYINYETLEIPLGASRVGGPVVDLPDEISYPENMNFMAQLDLNLFFQYDDYGLLPKRGFLYFFVDNSLEKGKVVYSVKEVTQLNRVKKEHKGNYHFGRLIGNVSRNMESLSDRYMKKENGVIKTAFDGTGVSKIYGLYSAYQNDLNETLKSLEEIDTKDQVILLQIGRDFNEKGVQTVLISKNKLKEKKFEECIFKFNYEK